MSQLQISEWTGETLIRTFSRVWNLKRHFYYAVSRPTPSQLFFLSLYVAWIDRRTTRSIFFFNYLNKLSPNGRNCYSWLCEAIYWPQDGGVTALATQVVGQGEQQAAKYRKQHRHMGVPPRRLWVVREQSLTTAASGFNISTVYWTSVHVVLTFMAPRQNPYNRAATSTLRMRLNRDERGLVVAEEKRGVDQCGAPTRSSSRLSLLLIRQK